MKSIIYITNNLELYHFIIYLIFSALCFIVICCQVTDEERKVIGGDVIVRTMIYSNKKLRFVLHGDISLDDINLAKKKFQFVLQDLANKNNSLCQGGT